MSDEMVGNNTKGGHLNCLKLSNISCDLVFKITSWITAGIKCGTNVFHAPVFLIKEMLEVKQRWFCNSVGIWRIRERRISCIIYQVTMKLWSKSYSTRRNYIEYSEIAVKKWFWNEMLMPLRTFSFNGKSMPLEICFFFFPNLT